MCVIYDSDAVECAPAHILQLKVHTAGSFLQ